jgi:hypothetical protein
MALPTSGQITAAMINLELKRAATAPFSLNDTAVRALAKKPSGPISFQDFYGKSASTDVYFNATTYADRTNVDGYPGADYVYAYPPANSLDHGGTMDYLLKQVSWGGPDGNWTYGFYYSLYFKAAGAAPSWAGSLKVTNVTTGVSLILPKIGARAWQLYKSAPGLHDLDPNENWCRMGRNDQFSIEEA